MQWTTRSRRRLRSLGSTTPRSAAGSRSRRSRTSAPTSETSSEKKVRSIFTLHPMRAALLTEPGNDGSPGISGGNFHTLVSQKIKSRTFKNPRTHILCFLGTKCRVC